MRCPSLACRLLTHSIASVNDRSSRGDEFKVHGNAVLLRLQVEIMQTRALTRPFFDPCDPPTLIKSSIAKCPTRELLEMMEFISADLRDCKVSEFDVPLNKARWRQGPGRISDTLAKKCELKTKLLAFPSPQIACEIPPLSFEFGMAAMIRWKLIGPPRQRHSPIGMRHRHDEEQTKDAEQS